MQKSVGKMTVTETMTFDAGVEAGRRRKTRNGQKYLSL